jgi:hypothetical protein
MFMKNKNTDIFLFYIAKCFAAVNWTQLKCWPKWNIFCWLVIVLLSLGEQKNTTRGLPSGSQDRKSKRWEYPYPGCVPTRSYLVIKPPCTTWARESSFKGPVQSKIWFPVFYIHFIIVWFE